MLSQIYDYVISFVTRTSQAQRILLDLDLVDIVFSLLKDLEPVSYKVHDPKVLAEFQSHCGQKLNPYIFSEIQSGSKEHERIADLVMKNLEIDPKYRHLVLDSVVQMCKFYSDLKKFDETCLVEISEKNHGKHFEKIWKVLENRKPPKSLHVSKSDDANSWGCLGFQMPLTDFRKTGLLGLLSLAYMVETYPESSKKALELSRREQNWFPFTLTSINVTSWVLDFYNEGKLNCFSYNNDSEPLETFYTLHSYFFLNFVKFFLNSSLSNDIFNFNKVKYSTISNF
uniref:ELMO/CED-12 family, putative n=1 Tax=Theileria annulata TaxID=5874 RepID=A0A3B0MMW9_THEAN